MSDQYYTLLGSVEWLLILAPFDHNEINLISGLGL